MTPSQQRRAYLDDFWQEYGKDGRKSLLSIRPKTSTLDALVRIGSVVVDSRNQLHARRETFNRVKYTRHSLISHSQCFACRNEAHVRHHIIWLKHGGDNSKRNLVSLCNSCHAVIHPWLASNDDDSYKVLETSYGVPYMRSPDGELTIEFSTVKNRPAFISMYSGRDYRHKVHVRPENVSYLIDLLVAFRDVSGK